MEAPEYVTLLTINVKTAAWDASMQANFDLIRRGLHTYTITNHTPGNVGTPSRIWIQFCDWEGTPITDVLLGRLDRLRVRVCDLDGWANATNATIALAGATTVRETLTAGKDLIFESNAAGLYEIDLTDTTAEQMTLRIGAPTLGGRIADYVGSLDVTHA